MEQQGSPIAIFCCYAHEDAKLLSELMSHLRPLQRLNIVNIGDDGDINAGTERGPAIKKHLNDAQIILLLISHNFINSDYCYSTEMLHSLERHDQQEACVIPILLSPVSGWEKVPSGNTKLGDLQVLPPDARAVTTWNDRNSAWEAVAEGIGRVANELRKNPSNGNFSQRGTVRQKNKVFDLAPEGTLSKKGNQDSETGDTGHRARTSLPPPTLPNEEDADKDIQSFAHRTAVEQSSVSQSLRLLLLFFSTRMSPIHLPKGTGPSVYF